MSATLRKVWHDTLDWSHAKLPPGMRLVAGLLLMVAGVFGFLPVIGFWMLPLGIAVAMLDIKPIWRWMVGRKKL